MLKPAILALIRQILTVARVAKSRLLGARWPLTYPPRLQRLPTIRPGKFLTTTNEI